MRKRAYKKAKRTNTQANWVKFRRLRNETTSMIRNSNKLYIDSLSNKLKSETLSSKQWWTVLKTFISPNSTSTIPPLERYGLVYSDEVEKANIFNDFFRDQTLLDEENVTLPAIDNFIINEPLSSLVFTSEEVKTVLRTLPVGKAVGPGGISNRILRELANELSTPLASLFNQSIHQGDVPVCFKIAHVCPVPKGGGDPSDVCNYRPISVLSNLDKVFERLVFKHLFNHLRDNNILTSFQSGFIPGDSTTNQLTFLYNTFCQALDADKEVRAVFCDISKAFDRVWHAGLLHKLRSIGISGELLKWFSSYFVGRKQRVVLQGVESQWNYINAGVPQGSILGPLLFLIFINDIVTEIGSSIRVFADDTSLFIIVDNPELLQKFLMQILKKVLNGLKLGW